MRRIVSAKAIENIREQVLAEEPPKIEEYENYLVVFKPIIEDLAQLGYQVRTLTDLRHQKKRWTTALPILLHWLTKVKEPRIKEDIVRCLSVPWAGNDATAELIEEFREYAPILAAPSNPWIGDQLVEISTEEKRAAPYFSLAWTIGNALSIVTIKGFEKQILDLCRDRRNGQARQMLVRSLGRLNIVEAEQAALELLNDDQVRLHAISALRVMKSKAALPELEVLSSGEVPAIRREALKAIAIIRALP